MEDEKLRRRREYQREYMRAYRSTHPRTEGDKEYRRAYARGYARIKRATDPDWVEKHRADSRERMAKHRADPDVRKVLYAKHAEWARKNKDRLNAKAKERNSTPEGKRRNKSYLVRSVHGISLAEYEGYVEREGGACAICRRPFDDLLKPRLDHNHETGAIRGALCSRCNLNLHIVEKYGDLLPAMVAYLQTRGSQPA